MYAKAIKVSVAELLSLNIERADFHPEWNYTIGPRVREGRLDSAVIVA
jgi:Rhodopirellula transposase.